MGSRETLLIEALVVDYKKKRANERKKIRKREREKERAKCIHLRAHARIHTHTLSRIGSRETLPIEAVVVEYEK